MNNIDPEAYLRDVLAKVLARHPEDSTSYYTIDSMEFVIPGRLNGLAPE